MRVVIFPQLAVRCDSSVKSLWICVVIYGLYRVHTDTMLKEQHTEQNERLIVFQIKGLANRAVWLPLINEAFIFLRVRVCVCVCVFYFSA